MTIFTIGELVHGLAIIVQIYSVFLAEEIIIVLQFHCLILTEMEMLESVLYQKKIHRKDY